MMCCVCTDRGCEHCPSVSTVEDIARRAVLKLNLSRGDLGCLSDRECSALAAVLLCRLDLDADLPWSA